MKTNLITKKYEYQVIRQFNPLRGSFYWDIEAWEIDGDVCVGKRDLNGLFMLTYEDAVKKYGDEENKYITTDILGAFASEDGAQRFIQENYNLYEFQNRYRDKFIGEYKTPYEFI